MTVLKAYTQIAKGLKDPISDQLRELLTKIDIQSNKILNLVQQLLDISKIENGHHQYNMKSVKINDFLSRQVAVIQHIMPSQDFVTNLTEDTDVVIDEARMEQVLANLLGNAVKYSNKNTTISLTTSLNITGLITVSITDHGRGMSADTIASVFEKVLPCEGCAKNPHRFGNGAIYIIKDYYGPCR